MPIWKHKRCNWCAYSNTIVVVFSRPAIRCLVTKLAILFDDEQQAPEGMFQNLDKIGRYDITERHVLRKVMHSSLFQRHIIRNLHSPWMTQGSCSSRSARVDPCHTQRSAYLSRLGCSWQSRDAAVHADRQRKHVALPGRQGSDRRREMGARHGRSASDDPIRDGDRKT